MKIVLTILAVLSFAAVSLAQENVFQSPMPPAGLELSKTPMIVTFGFDDNAHTGKHTSDNGGGMQFVQEMFASKSNNIPGQSACHVSLYAIGAYLENDQGDWGSEKSLMTAAYNGMTSAGNNIANHTLDHMETNCFTGHDTWKSTVQANVSSGVITDQGWVEFAGEKLAEEEWNWVLNFNHTHLNSKLSVTCKGFRAPRLEFNDNGLKALKALSYDYDVSLEEGLYPSMDGTNYLWPFTLDNGSAGIWLCMSWEYRRCYYDMPQGLWELPLHVLQMPSDLQMVIGERMWTEMQDDASVDKTWLDELKENGVSEIAGLDFNTFVFARMYKDEWVKTMQLNFDLRNENNKCPMMFGCHSDYYSIRYDKDILTAPQNKAYLDVLDYNTYDVRQQALEEFVDYVLGKGAWIMSNEELVTWLKSPKDKDGNAAPGDPVGTPAYDKYIEFVSAEDWVVDDDSADGLNSTCDHTISGKTMDINFHVDKCTNNENGPWPHIALSGYVAEGHFRNVTHVEIEYETNIHVRVGLVHSGLKEFPKAILGHIGSKRTANIRIQDFTAPPYYEGNLDDMKVTPEFMKKVVGLEFDAAPTEEDKTNEINFKIHKLTLHGFSEETSVNPSHELKSGEYVMSLNDITRNKVNFTTPKAGLYTISLYSLDGKRVKTIFNNYLKQGNNSIIWNGNSFASNMYIFEVAGKDAKVVKKSLLIKN